MSLNWNLTAVKSWRGTGKMVSKCDDNSHDGGCKRCGERPQMAAHLPDGSSIPWQITNGLIWSTMALDMGEIDAKGEFATRLAIYYRLFPDGEVKITTAQVQAHVGLRCNVTTRTRGQWLKRMTEIMAREAAQAVSDEILAALKEVAK